MKILISGAGISGLTAALRFARLGHEVDVFERAAQIKEVGAGLQISPNGVRVLAALAIEDAVRAVSFEPERIEMRMGETGRVVFDIPLKREAEARWGARYYHIHRADLLECLLKAAEAESKIRMHTGWPVDAVTESAESVTVTSTSGETVQGDLLIGADGIHSVVREYLLGADSPRFTGCVAWRGVIETDRIDPAMRPPPTACAWVGKGAHAVTYYLRGGKLINLVGVVERSDWRTESWSEKGTKEAFLEDFKGWHPSLLNLIHHGDDFFRWALFDRAPLARWIGERTVLLGDACHPMLPFLAQGAVMALEDAYVLGDCVQDGTNLASSLKRYQDLRLARTAKVQVQARNNMGVFHRRSPAAQIATYGPMWLAGQLAPQVVHRRMDWLYGHDVTE